MKKPLDQNVYDAAQERIKFVFDHFPKIYLSFSAGKDSSVMLHMVLDEAKRRNRKIGLLLIDLEAQYKLTIEHGLECFEEYADNIEPYWVSLPIALRNAVSMYEPKWLAWDPKLKDSWVRTAPDIAITDPNYFPFFHPGMEFEEFIVKFGEWYSHGQQTACFVGIRCDESLNRFRTINSNTKIKFENKCWTTKVADNLYNIYPIYDWKTTDIWVFNHKFQKKYNKLYDLMNKAGLTIHQQRICQPYGDDQRKGLWLYHIIEPETWAKIVARVNGANSGSLYAQESGNILGRIKINKPGKHTWQSFARLLLSSMPKPSKEQFENKITVFINWWMKHGYPDGIPDEADYKLEASKKAPSWRRICKSLLRNDYWCKGLSFTQTNSDPLARKRYEKVMEDRKKKWGISW